MYARNGYIPITIRIHKKEEDTVSSKYIHLRLGAIPTLNIKGVYMKPTNIKKDAKATQKVRTDKVQRCVDGGENYGTQKNTSSRHTQGNAHAGWPNALNEVVELKLRAIGEERKMGQDKGNNEGKMHSSG